MFRIEIRRSARPQGWHADEPSGSAAPDQRHRHPHDRGFGSIPDIEKVVIEVATIDLDDGIVFDAGTFAAEQIREAADYPGVRVSMDADLHTSRNRLKLDLSFGDPSDPQPEQITLQRILPDMPPLVTPSFPLTMVIAEKIVTAVARGTANTRWRDFADIIAITWANEVDGAVLVRSISAVSEHRGIELSPIAEMIDDYVAVADDRWRAWHTSQPYDVSAPVEFGDTLAEVSRFADPAMAHTAVNLRRRPDSGWGNVG